MTPAFRLTLAKLILVGVFLAWANFGISERISLLVDNSRWGTLIPYLLIWLLAVAAVLVAAFQPNVWVRLFWALLISLSSAAAWGYHKVSQSDLTVFDIVSLWNARHEAGRAAEFYGAQAGSALVLLAAGLLVMMMTPAATERAGLWLKRLSWVPAVPVILIAGIVYLKAGGGSQAMPWQFTPMALSSLAGAKIALQGVEIRKPVAWQPLAQGRRDIIMLVDESVRADYLDLTPGNPHTPRLAALADQFVDFGPAVSGGDCSNYSNAILRFAASRRDLVASVSRSPTIFQYARKAGFRTVFIDAQAGVNKNPGLLQNFMSLGEKTDIDGFYAIQDVGSDTADMRLAEIIAIELKSALPVFIYANKNGAHFPYDHAYPAAEGVYRPSMTESGADTEVSRIASYRNAISWSVDRFMETLFRTADLTQAVLVYTADHGQKLIPGELTHCAVDNTDPRMGLVPLMVYAADPALRAELQRGAALSHGKASHFQIAPSLLAWMGYRAADLATAYDESLSAGTGHPPAFTSGDIFGLFSNDLHWTPVDIGLDYLEPKAKALMPYRISSGAEG